MILIAEKLNSSVPETAQALSSSSPEALERIIESQKHADYIDINTALCPNEAKAMFSLIDMVMKMTDCGISIDTQDPELLFSAAKKIEDRPVIINSVTPDIASGTKLLSLRSKKACRIIAMPVAHTGKLPKSVSERVDAVGELTEMILKHGFAKEAVFADVLCTSCAQDPDGALLMLDTATKIKESFPGICTVAGLSNFSFGLPDRAAVTSALLPMVMYAGLDAAILDVSNTRILDSFFASTAILDSEKIIEYIDYIRKCKSNRK